MHDSMFLSSLCANSFSSMLSYSVRFYPGRLMKNTMASEGALIAWRTQLDAEDTPVWEVGM